MLLAAIPKLALRANLRRASATVWIAGAVLFGGGGCIDITCPSGFVQQGDACVCANGQVGTENCASPEMPPNDGDRPPIDRAADAAAPADEPTLNQPSAQPGRRDGGRDDSPGETPGGGSAVNPAASRPSSGTNPLGTNPSPTPPPGPPAGGPRGSTPQAMDWCDDGNDRPTDACVDGHKPAECNDGVIRAGVEECEIGHGGWTAENCVDCRRKRFRECAETSQCLDGKVVLAGGDVRADVCFNNVCAPFACGENAEPSCTAKCPELWGFDVFEFNTMCLIRCEANKPCPLGLRCDSEMAICVGASFARSTE